MPKLLQGAVALTAVTLLTGCATDPAGERVSAGAFAEEACLAGRYNGAATEIGVRLNLGEDGRFQYLLIYGALDERAEGQWAFSDGAVVLTSDPVTEPVFKLLADEPAGNDQWHFELDVPDGLSRQYFDVELSLADGTGQVLPFGEDGLALEGIEAGSVSGVRVLLPLFGLASPLHEPAGPRPRRITYRFTPNDLGKVAFVDKVLPAGEASLLFERHGRMVRLFREGGPCEEAASR